MSEMRIVHTAKGRKFNAKKEQTDKRYLNEIPILHFCFNEIVWKTDPENKDHTTENGATRFFEPCHDEGVAKERDGLHFT
jgi:hypothetical protein